MWVMLVEKNILLGHILEKKNLVYSLESTVLIRVHEFCQNVNSHKSRLSPNWVMIGQKLGCKVKSYTLEGTVLIKMS